MAQPIKFFTDEHVPPAIALGLRQRGIYVITIQETGMLGESDEVLLQFCKREGCVIFTQDDDFLRLHANGVPHAGIIYPSTHTGWHSYSGIDTYLPGIGCYGNS